MKKSRLLGAVCATTITLTSSSIEAALVSRLGGEAVYDTDRDITWLANANLAKSNTFGIANIADGAMRWDTAFQYIDAMNNANYLGIDTWRLSPLQGPDACTNDTSGTIPSSPSWFGYNCNASELSHMFYTELGGTAGLQISESTDPDLALFSNIEDGINAGQYGIYGIYWSSTHSVRSAEAWTFHFWSGYQTLNATYSWYYVWPVASSDIFASTVPIPPAFYLFGSGLLGLIGMARRKSA